MGPGAALAESGPTRSTPGLGARDGSAAGPDLHQVDGLDVHRDAAAGLEPDPVELELADGLRPAIGDEGELGGGAAHVERDQVGVAGELAVGGGHEGAGGRAGLDHPHGVARHRLGGGDAPAGLHDEEAPAIVERRERLLEPPEVVAHRGHHVGVDHGRRRPLVLPDDRGDLGRQADRHARRFLVDDLGRTPLVRRVRVRVEEADGDRLHAVPPETLDGPAEACLVEWHQHLAVERHPLGDLPDARAGNERRGLLDEEVVELVPLLAADDQDVAESAGREERDVAALPLDHDVRAERRAVHGLGELRPFQPRAGDELLQASTHARAGSSGVVRRLPVRRRRPRSGGRNR
jgi:hypothetical protein